MAGGHGTGVIDFGAFPGTNEEIDREIDRLTGGEIHQGVPKRVERIIETVAARQLSNLHLDDLQRIEELQRELLIEDIVWHSRYLEILENQRRRLIDAELTRLLKKIQAEEDTVMLLVLVSSVV